MAAAPTMLSRRIGKLPNEFQQGEKEKPPGRRSSPTIFSKPIWRSCGRRCQWVTHGGSFKAASVGGPFVDIPGIDQELRQGAFDKLGNWYFLRCGSALNRLPDCRRTGLSPERAR
jgi:hypothetical protein